MKILLLNDNPVVNKLVTLSAQKTTDELDTAKSIDDIVNAAYDLVILDDSVGGEDILKKLEERISFRKTLYICSRDAAATTVFDATLKKPFLPTDLVELFVMLDKEIQEAGEDDVLDIEELDGFDELSLDEELDLESGELELDLEGSDEEFDLNLDEMDDDDIQLDEINDDVQLDEIDHEAAESVLDDEEAQKVKDLLDETSSEDLDENLDELEELNDEQEDINLEESLDNMLDDDILNDEELENSTEDKEEEFDHDLEFDLALDLEDEGDVDISEDDTLEDLLDSDEDVTDEDVLEDSDAESVEKDLDEDAMAYDLALDLEDEGDVEISEDNTLEDLLDSNEDLDEDVLEEPDAESVEKDLDEDTFNEEELESMLDEDIIEDDNKDLEDILENGIDPVEVNNESDIEQQIQDAVEDLSEEELESELDEDTLLEIATSEIDSLDNLSSKDLKLALGEEIDDEDESQDELKEQAEVDLIKTDLPEDSNHKVEGVEALKKLLEVLSDNNVAASMKGMKITINIELDNR